MNYSFLNYLIYRLLGNIYNLFIEIFENLLLVVFRIISAIILNLIAIKILLIMEMFRIITNKILKIILVIHFSHHKSNIFINIIKL